MCVSAQGTKEQNKPEVAWQHKTLPNVNFGDTGTAGGEEKKKEEREKKKMQTESRKKEAVTAMHYSFLHYWFWKELVLKKTLYCNIHIRHYNMYSCLYLCTVHAFLYLCQAESGQKEYRLIRDVCER